MSNVNQAEDVEAFRRNMQGNKSQKSINWLYPEEGNTRVRVLPNKDGVNERPFALVFMHSGFMHPNYGKTSQFRCAGKGCPLCEYAKQQADEENPKAWKFKARPKFIYNVVDSNDNFRVMVLDKGAHEELQAEIENFVVTHNRIPCSFDKGAIFDISLKIVENGRKKEYKWKVSIHSESAGELGNAVTTELKDSRPLSEIYRRYSHEDLTKVLNGEKLERRGGDSEPKAEAEAHHEEAKAPSTAPAETSAPAANRMSSAAARKLLEEDDDL